MNFLPRPLENLLLSFYLKVFIYSIRKFIKKFSFWWVLFIRSLNGDWKNFVSKKIYSKALQQAHNALEELSHYLKFIQTSFSLISHSFFLLEAHYFKQTKKAAALKLKSFLSRFLAIKNGSFYSLQLSIFLIFLFHFYSMFSLLFFNQKNLCFLFAQIITCYSCLIL